MIQNHERSPIINELTFKKKPYTNNGHCNIFLPKYRLEEIDKRMPQFNYYKRLGKELVTGSSNDQQQSQQKVNNNNDQQHQQSNQIISKTENQNKQKAPQNEIQNQHLEKSQNTIQSQKKEQQQAEILPNLSKLVESIEYKNLTSNKLAAKIAHQQKFLQKSSVFQLSSQNIVSPTNSKSPNFVLNQTKEQTAIDLNPEIKNTLFMEQKILNQNQNLVSQIYKLNDLKLLNSYPSKSQKQQGIFKINFINNDYHSRATNPGYARNGHGGSFFTK